MRAAIVLVLLAAGCSTVWDPHSPKTVTGSDEGGAVTLKHGERLHLPLAADPGGQYEWRLAEPPSVRVCTNARCAKSLRLSTMSR